MNVQGHGPCDDYSRSVTLPRFIASTSDIAKEAKLLLKMLAIPPQELRGVGLAVSVLVSFLEVSGPRLGIEKDASRN